MTTHHARTPSPRRHAPVRLLNHAAIGVVGTGQIGGSLLRALGVYRPALDLFAFDARPALAARVRRHAVWCPTLAELVCRCDMVVLAVPVQDVVRLLPAIANAAAVRHLCRRLVVCDTATVKSRVVAAAAACADAFAFVGLHPLAGTERSGWEGADPDLFVGRPFVFCPGDRRATVLARELIALVGGVPVTMRADDHDRRAATGIGLPHALAFAAAGLPSPPSPGPSLRGGSWNSLTRVSASNPSMVAGFLQANVRHQRRALRQLRARLDVVDRLLKSGSLSRLESQLRRWQLASPRRTSGA